MGLAITLRERSHRGFARERLPHLGNDTNAGASWPEKNIERLSATGSSLFEIKSPFVSPSMIDFVNNFYPIVARAQRSRRANAHPDVGM
jgi:hypothetical protein